MSLVLAFLLFLAHQETSNHVSNHNSKFPNDINFLDDFPIIVHGGSFFTFDTTSLLKQRFIFVVSGTKIAYFKKGSRLFIVNSLKREIKQNSYIDYFEGSGYKIKLDVVKGKRISKSRIRYTGVLELIYNESVTTIYVHGINEEHKLNSVR